MGGLGAGPLPHAGSCYSGIGTFSPEGDWNKIQPVSRSSEDAEGGVSCLVPRAGTSRPLPRRWLNYCSMNVSYSSRESFDSSHCIATSTMMSSDTA